MKYYTVYQAFFIAYTEDAGFLKIRLGTVIMEIILRVLNTQGAQLLGGV